jgi:hypothetical protein
VGSVSVASFINSRLFAGYTGADDGTGTFNPVASTVGPFTVRAVRNQTNVFAQSFVIASNFKAVSLAAVDTTITGTKFGFTYHTKIAGLAVKAPPFKFDLRGLPTQDLPASDFEVKKI